MDKITKEDRTCKGGKCYACQNIICCFVQDVLEKNTKSFESLLEKAILHPLNMNNIFSYSKDCGAHTNKALGHKKIKTQNKAIPRISERRYKPFVSHHCYDAFLPAGD